MNDASLFPDLLQLLIETGRQVLPFWQRADLIVHEKSDQSPITAADLAAHHCLVAGLQRVAPLWPVLSEEDCQMPLSQRALWERWWLIDPLDGTREFISGSTEFTLNVALIEQGQVVLGIVGLPAQGLYYYGGRGKGAWCFDQHSQQHRPILSTAAPQPERWVISRRHGSIAQERLIQAIQHRFGHYTLAHAGSSLKFCLVAEGQADCYPRLAPTSQWDTAAAQGILEGAGGNVRTLDGQPLDYPARSDFINPPFLAFPAQAPWENSVLTLAQNACALDSED